MKKNIFDRIGERLRNRAGEDREPDRSGFSQALTWGFEEEQYRAARALKRRLLEANRGRRLAEIIQGEEISTAEGVCYHVRTKEPLAFRMMLTGQVRERLLSDLKLIYGIGKYREGKLRAAGIGDVRALCGHPRYGREAAALIELVERGDSKGLLRWIARWYPQSHPQAFRPSGFHDRGDFVILDIETLGLFTRPIILIGIAEIRDDFLVTSQYLAREISEEPAALTAALSHVRENSALVTFNGRMFDIPYIRERLAYYGLRSDLDRAHFDVLPFSRRAWGEESPNCRLVTLENFLFGMERNDDVPSSLVPEFFETYLRTGNPGPLIPIVEHNRLDLLSLAGLFSKLHEVWSRD